MKLSISKQKERLLIIILITLVPYLALYSYNLDNPERYLMYDSYHYIDLAEGLTSGSSYVNPDGEPEFLRTPGYPLFLAFFFFIGFSPAMIILIQIGLMSITSLIIYKIIRYIGYSENMGFVGMLVYSLSGIVLVQMLFLVSEALYTFFIVLSFYFLIRYQKENSIRFLLFSSSFLAFGVYVRPISIYFIAVTAVLLFYFSKRGWKDIKYILLMLIVFLVLVTPWVIRNYSLSGTPQFSTVGDIAIIIYTYPVYSELHGGADYDESIAGILSETSEHYSWEGDIDLFSIRKTPEKVAKIREYAVNRYVFGEPLIYLKHHVLGIMMTFIPNSVNEFGRILDGVDRFGFNMEIAMNIFNPEFISKNIVLALFKFYELFVALVTYVLAFFGILYSIRQRKHLFLLSLMFMWILYNVNLASTYGLDRYLIPQLPLIAVFSAIGFWTITKKNCRCMTTLKRFLRI